MLRAPCWCGRRVLLVVSLLLLLLIDDASGFAVPIVLLSSTQPGQQSFRWPWDKEPTSKAVPEPEKDEPPSIIYDLVVIGAGPVGVNAALSAAQLYGRTVCLVDAPRASGQLLDSNGKDLSLGGPTGLFSKALRDTSKRIPVATLRGMGLREDSVWNEILQSCVSLAGSNAADMQRQLDMAGVHCITGLAALLDSDSEGEDSTRGVKITPEDDPASSSSSQQSSTTIIKAKHVLLATGSKPFQPAGIPFDNGKRVFDSDSINQLSYLPKSIAITGSGIIAVEFAKILRNLEADVTLIIRDTVPRNALMKIGLDKDVAACLVADLIRSGIKVERGAQVKEFHVPADNANAPIRLTLEARGGGPLPTNARTEVKCDCYLAAVGRQPNTQNLNLEAAGVQMDEYGGILVDATLQTTAPNVYAAGDVVGRPFLASTGVSQAIAAVSFMFEDKNEASAFPECEEGDKACEIDGVAQAGIAFDPASLASNPFAFPCGVWSSPEAAYYGYSVQQAKERGIDAGEGISLYAECLRGRVFSPDGLLKLVFDKQNGRILGVHICGADACELIHYGMELVKSQRTVKQISQGIFSAVTFHEMYKIAAQAALDEAGARKRRAAAGRALAQRNREVRNSNLGE